jgi:molybdenum cofactor biosynthesis protein B
VAFAEVRLIPHIKENIVHQEADFVSLNIAVLTLSDTRNNDNDTSGQALEDLLLAAGHNLAARDLCPDDVYMSRAVVSAWIADDGIDIILTTGGTGLTARDSTPESLGPLFDREVDGFGELFRQLSFTEIGTSTIQSRSLAGLANQTLIFCLPGSTGACRTGWNGILAEQLDSRHRPCNFVAQTRSGAHLR